MFVECVLDSVELCQFAAVITGAGVVEADEADFRMLVQVFDGAVEFSQIADVAYEAIVVFMGDESTAGQMPVAVEVDGEVVVSSKAVGRAGEDFRLEMLIDLLQGAAGIWLGQVPVGKPEVVAVEIFKQGVAEFFAQAVTGGKKLLCVQGSGFIDAINQGDVVVEGVYPAVLTA